MTDLITTDLTPVPSRQSPATFSSYGDTLIGKLPTWTTEANALATGANTNATNAAASAAAALTSAANAAASEIVAAGVANFLGNWADLTGAKSLGISVYHNSEIWILLVNVANITASEPALDNTDWLIFRVVRGGSESSSGAVDVTLTSASKQVQNVTITAVDKFVILPDATTLPEGADTFVFNNEGAYRFGVKDSAGTFVCSIDVSGHGSVNLVDNSTAAGTWRTSDGADLIMNRIRTVCNSDGAFNYAVSCKLTSTEVFVAWQGDASDGFCAVLTWTGSAITVSNILEFSETDVTYLSCCRMTDTVAIIGYADADSDGKCSAITWDGTDTLTVTDTHEFKDTGTVSYVSLVPIYEHASTGKIGVFYRNADTYLYAQVLNWTGTEITANTAETAIHNADAVTYVKAGLFSGAVGAASLLVQYVKNGSLYAKQVAWNGTTLTPHIVVGTDGATVQASVVTNNSLVALNSSYAVSFAYRYEGGGTHNLVANLIYWSGSALAVKRKLIVASSYDTLYFDYSAAQLVDSDTIIFTTDAIVQGHATVYKIKAVGSTVSKDCVLKVQNQIDVGYIAGYSNTRTTALHDSTGGLFIYDDGDIFGFMTAQRIDVGA